MKTTTTRAAVALGFALTVAPLAEAGLFKVERDDYTIKFGGRLMSDWAIIDEDADTEEALGNQNGGHEFRRARLYASGTLYDGVIFKVQYDFAGGDADFKDAYIGLKGNFGTIKMGHFKEPFSLEERTSSKYISFMERSLPNAFAPGRNAGIQFSKAFGGEKKKERGTFAFGVFKDADDFGVATDEDDWAVTGRFTALPMFEGVDKLFHVGAAFRHAEPKGGQVRFRARPEMHLTSRYVNTDRFDADSETRFGAEFGAISGRASFQGEYLYATTDAPDVGDPSFNGFYLYGSFFLTEDDHRAYKNSAGAFSRVKPSTPWRGKNGGSGAWEVAARYSQIDLDDGAVAGGELKDFSLGVNWYLNPYTRMMFNYVRADLDNVGETNGFMIRWQVDF